MRTSIKVYGVITQIMRETTGPQLGGQVVLKKRVLAKKIKRDEYTFNVHGFETGFTNCSFGLHIIREA